MSLSPALLIASVLAGAAGAMLRSVLDRWLSPRGVLAANVLAALLAGAAWPMLGERADAAFSLPVASTFVLALGTFSTLTLQAADAAASAGGPTTTTNAGTPAVGAGAIPTDAARGAPGHRGGWTSGAGWGSAARLWALHLGLGAAALVVGRVAGAWLVG